MRKTNVAELARAAGIGKGSFCRALLPRPELLFALLGVTGLSGVVVNDSIVMVTSLNQTGAEQGSVGELTAEVTVR